MPDTLSMKVLTVVSVAIVVVDLEVLRKTFVEYFQLKQVLENEPYQQCYKPQAHLRIVFQCYAIFAALICTTLTSMLALKVTDHFVEAVARLIINLCFMIFGPVLLTFVNYGFVHFKQLAFVCTPRGASHRINFLDIILILACFILALCVTFTMAMQKTLDMAQQSFQDENSLIYRLTSMYFSYQVRQSQERDRQQLRLRSDERREQRRLRQAEREQVLTAFQNRHPEIAMPTTSHGRGPNSVCPPQTNSATSQASTVAMNVPQRAIDAGVRVNRDLGTMLVPEDRRIGMNDIPLQTMQSSQNDQRHILAEDFDEEMHNNFQVNPERATDYEYAQTQEDKHINNMMSNMPEAQIINQYKSLNQQFQSNDLPQQSMQSKLTVARYNQERVAAAGNFAGQLDDSNLYMKNEEQKEQELPEVVETEEMGEQVEGEQLIKDGKTSSGVSISQASTNMQTFAGTSLISSSVGAAVASSQPASNIANGANQQRPSIGAVPSSSQIPEQSLQDTSLALDQQSDIAFQSIDGAASMANFSTQSKPNVQKKND